MAERLTRKALEKCHMRAVMFADLVGGGYMQRWVIDEHPRLEKQVRADRRGVDPTTTWIVGDRFYADLEAAIRAYNDDLAGEEFDDFGKATK